DFVEAAPTLPGNSRLRLPPTSPHRYDGRAMAVFHLHPKQQRLTAHILPDHHTVGPRVRPGGRTRRSLRPTLGDRAVLRRDRNPPKRRRAGAPIPHTGTGETRDLVAATRTLRDTTRHERRRRYRRHRPRRPIIHEKLPRNPPPGFQPGGLFP